MSLVEIKKHLRKCSSRRKAKASRWFFKTGPGEYGEGDLFIGVTMPELRGIARLFADASDKNIEKLIKSAVHEERMLALLILVLNFKKGSPREKSTIHRFYKKHMFYVNNWDLVDCSAEHLMGTYLLEKSRRPLYKLARSKNLWYRRIAIVSTFSFIKKQQYEDTLAIAGMLINDKEDLIHKASGWMLREVGKRSIVSEEGFLRKNYKAMPRTMLRYSIERFPEKKRKMYLSGKI